MPFFENLGGPILNRCTEGAFEGPKEALQEVPKADPVATENQGKVWEGWLRMKKEAPEKEARN